MTRKQLTNLLLIQDEVSIVIYKILFDKRSILSKEMMLRSRFLGAICVVRELGLES